MVGMKKSAILAAVAVLHCIACSPARASDDANLHSAWETSGDLMQIAIPLVGFGVSFFLGQDDEPISFDLSALSVDPNAAQASGINWPGPSLGKSPTRDFTTSFGRTLVMTYGLKYAINAERPNGKGHSFPSGHTSTSFMGAEFIRKHCGNWWGVPAYAAAGWVGWTRVDSKNHYWRDVIAGAAIGIASNHDFNQLETKYGTLSFSPAMLESKASLWDRPDPLQDNPFDSSNKVSAPGIMFEWRF